MTDLSRFALSFPVVSGETVTEGHARYCREFGHATDTENGEESRFCPRCGEDKTAERLFAKANPAPETQWVHVFGADRGARCESGPAQADDALCSAHGRQVARWTVQAAERVAAQVDAEREADASKWGTGTGRNGLTRG